LRLAAIKHGERPHQDDGDVPFGVDDSSSDSDDGDEYLDMDRGQDAEAVRIHNLSVDMAGELRMYNMGDGGASHSESCLGTAGDWNLTPSADALNEGGEYHAKGPQPTTDKEVLTIQGHWDRKKHILVEIVLDTVVESRR